MMGVPWKFHYKNLQQNGENVPVTDSKCADALLGGGLCPSSKSDKWNCYIEYGNISHTSLDCSTRQRSGLGLQTNQENQVALFNIPLTHTVLGPNHLISHVMEKVLKMLVKQIHQTPSWILNQCNGEYTHRVALGHLVCKISSRNVHQGKDCLFNFQFEKDQLKDLTLNTTTAAVILTPRGYFGDSSIGDILGNVLLDTPHKQIKPIPDKLREFSKLTKTSQTKRLSKPFGDICGKCMMY